MEKVRETGDYLILAFSLILLVGMFVVNVLISVVDKKRNNDYDSTTHEFDVIIGCLQTSKISGKIIKTPKLIKLMEERPKEIVDKNNLYEAWLDKVSDYIKHVNEEHTNSEMHIESSG